jgi:hypothetical protein
VQVLVDTCIWSLALRRQAKQLSVSEALLWGSMVEEGRAQRNATGQFSRVTKISRYTAGRFR